MILPLSLPFRWWWSGNPLWRPDSKKSESISQSRLRICISRRQVCLPANKRWIYTIWWARVYIVWRLSGREQLVDGGQSVGHSEWYISCKRLGNDKSRSNRKNYSYTLKKVKRDSIWRSAEYIFWMIFGIILFSSNIFGQDCVGKGDWSVIDRSGIEQMYKGKKDWVPESISCHHNRYADIYDEKYGLANQLPQIVG